MDADPGAPYTPAERTAVLGVARASISHGLARGEPLAADPTGHPPRLRQTRACFVTLEIDTTLRGCIGSLQARRALIAEVAHNAWAAAFADPRFPPLAAPELERISVHVSVLTPPQPLPAASEAELLAALRPGVDGLILEEGEYRATFLPSVWATLPRPQDFLDHLRRKAGLAPGHWSPALRFARYQAEMIGDPAP